MKINSDLQGTNISKGITANMGAAYSDVMAAYGNLQTYNQQHPPARAPKAPTC